MKKTSNILWGILLVIGGILLALDCLNIVNINIFFSGWWTLIIIIPCFIGLFTDSDKSSNLIGLSIGVFLLLCCQKILSFDLLLKLIIPIIIIVVGCKMIFGSFKSRKSEHIMQDVINVGGQVHNINATFSGQNVSYDGQPFTGAELNAVFGGIKLDLRNSVILNDCVVKSSAIFGGIDIFMPNNVNVKINSNSIFGGIDDKRHMNNPANTVTVYIEGTCMFGGVDIK